MAYARSFAIQYRNTDPYSGKRLAEPYPDNIWVVQNPASKPLTRQEMDDVYTYPYMQNVSSLLQGSRRHSGHF